MTTPFSGSNTEHWYVVETTAGVTPTTPVWTRLRNTGGIPALTKDTLISNELNGSREITSVRTGGKQVSGEFPVELSQSSQDELIANAMTSQWVAGVTGSALDITVDDAGKTFTRAAGDFLSDGVVVGDLVYFADLSGNNSKPFIATTVTSTVITGAGITVTLTDETLSTDYATADKIGTGSLCKSISLMTIFKGKCGTADKYLITRGLEFTGFSYEIAVNAQVTGSFPFIARSQEVVASSPAGSTYNTDSVTIPYSGVDGKILVENAVQALFTSATITNDNAASAQFELGSDSTSFIERGNATNTISVSAFMADTVLLERFINESETGFTSILVGVDGAMSFSLPNAFITAATPEIGGATSITQTVEATGTGNSNESSIIVQRLTY
jgi:hypothetical protein